MNNYKVISKQMFYVTLCGPTKTNVCYAALRDLYSCTGMVKQIRQMVSRWEVTLRYVTACRVSSILLH